MTIVNGKEYSNESIKKIAFYHKLFFYFLLSNLLINLLSHFFEKTAYGYYLSVYAIPVLVASILFITIPAIVTLIYLRNELKDNIVLTVLISILFFIPVLNILFVVGTISRGSKVLKAEGYRIGFLGLPWIDVMTLVRDDCCFLDKTLRSARIYYCISFVLVAVSCYLNYLCLGNIYYAIATDYFNQAERESKAYMSASAEQNYKTAVFLCEEAAKKGNDQAQYQTGRNYLDGFHLTKDAEKGAKYLSMAAEQGNVEAQVDYGICLLEGNGVRQDTEEAAELIRAAAEQGHPLAQYYLGRLLLQEGRTQNRNEGVEWLKLSAEQGVAPAQYDYGSCLFIGIGCQKNEFEGLVWIRKAAEQGYEDAENALKTLIP